MVAHSALASTSVAKNACCMLCVFQGGTGQSIGCWVAARLACGVFGFARRIAVHISRTSVVYSHTAVYVSHACTRRYPGVLSVDQHAHSLTALCHRVLFLHVCCLIARTSQLTLCRTALESASRCCHLATTPRLARMWCSKSLVCSQLVDEQLWE